MNTSRHNQASTRRKAIVSEGVKAYREKKYLLALKYFKEALQDLRNDNHADPQSNEYKEELASIRFNFGSTLSFSSFNLAEAIWHLEECLALRIELKHSAESILKTQAKIKEATAKYFSNITVGPGLRRVYKAIHQFASTTDEEELKAINKNYKEVYLFEKGKIPSKIARDQNEKATIYFEDTINLTYENILEKLNNLNFKQLMYLLEALERPLDDEDQVKIEPHLIVFKIIKKSIDEFLKMPRDSKNEINLTLFALLIANFVTKRCLTLAPDIKYVSSILEKEYFALIDKINEVHSKEVDWTAFEFFLEYEKEKFIKIASASKSDLFPLSCAQKQDLLTIHAENFFELGLINLAEKALKKATVILHERAKDADSVVRITPFYTPYYALYTHAIKKTDYLKAYEYMQLALEATKDCIHFSKKAQEQARKKFTPKNRRHYASLASDFQKLILNYENDLKQIKEKRIECKKGLAKQHYELLIGTLNIEGLTSPQADPLFSKLSFKIDKEKIQPKFLLIYLQRYSIPCKIESNQDESFLVFEHLHYFTERKIKRLLSAIESYKFGAERNKRNHQEPEVYIANKEQEKQVTAEKTEVKNETETAESQSEQKNTRAQPESKGKRRRRNNKSSFQKNTLFKPKEKEEETPRPSLAQPGDHISEPYFLEEAGKITQVVFINYSALHRLGADPSEIKNLEEICERGLLLFGSKGRKGSVKLTHSELYTLKAKDASKDFRFFAIPTDACTIDGVTYPANMYCGYSETHKKKPKLDKKSSPYRKAF